MSLSYQYQSATNPKSQKILCVFHGLGAGPFDLIPAVSFATDFHRYCFGAPSRIMPIFGKELCSGWFTWQQHFAFTQHNLIEMDLISSQIQEILKAKKHNLQSCEVHSLGFSQGGVMALRLSKVLPLTTLAFLSSFYDFSYQESFQLENTRVFSSYSACDSIVPSSQSLGAIHILEKKARSVEIYSNPLLGHGIDGKLISHYESFLRNTSH
jgi:predicted esterase